MKIKELSLSEPLELDNLCRSITGKHIGHT